MTDIPFTLVDKVLTSPHALALTGGAETHDPTLRFVDQLVSVTTDEDLILAIIRALLPKAYDGNSLDEVPRMISDAVAMGFHETGSDSGKPPKTSEIGLAIAEKAKPELFHDHLGEAHISIAQPEGGELTAAVNASSTKRWLRLSFYESQGRPINSQGLNEIIETWEAKALTGPMHRTHVRMGSIDNAAYVDIGDGSGRAVEITAEGWRVVPLSPVKFIRPAGMKTLPAPMKGGDLTKLPNLLGLDDLAWTRVLAFIINCYRPTGPYMPLLVSADQGSGKSVLSDIIKRIVDPNEIAKISLPRNEHELMIQAAQHALLVFDNVSYLRVGISDLFCRLATGGGMIVRKLYTDREVSVFNEYRAFLLNGIGSFADRPDLMERAIHLPLKAISDGERQTEKQIYAAFEPMLPGLLGAIYDIVAYALGEVDKIETPTSVRMADTAQWLVAAEPVTGLEPGSFITALVEGQEEMLVERAGNDPVLLALQSLFSLPGQNEFEGTVGQLHKGLLEVREQEKNRSGRFPSSPLTLSNALHRLTPAAELVGVHIEFGEKTKAGRIVRIKIDEEPVKPHAPVPAPNTGGDDDQGDDRVTTDPSEADVDAQNGDDDDDR